MTARGFLRMADRGRLQQQRSARLRALATQSVCVSGILAIYMFNRLIIEEL